MTIIKYFLFGLILIQFTVSKSNASDKDQKINHVKKSISIYNQIESIDKFKQTLIDLFSEEQDKTEIKNLFKKIDSFPKLNANYKEKNVILFLRDHKIIEIDEIDDSEGIIFIQGKKIRLPGESFAKLWLELETLQINPRRNSFFISIIPRAEAHPVAIPIKYAAQLAIAFIGLTAVVLKQNNDFEKIRNFACQAQTPSQEEFKKKISITLNEEMRKKWEKYSESHIQCRNDAHSNDLNICHDIQAAQRCIQPPSPQFAPARPRSTS